MFQALLGVVTGFLVGSMGIGAGALATPLLILVGVSPIIAVGTDLVFALSLKVFASALYGNEGEVDLTIVKRLLMGCLPAIMLSYFILIEFSTAAGVGLVNLMVKYVLGGALILTSLLHLFKLASGGELKFTGTPPLSLELLGFTSGALLFFTSVGSGILVLAFLLGICPTPRRAVGTSLVFSLAATSMAGLLHSSLGHVDLKLAFMLLVAGLPGVMLGHRLSRRAPKRQLTAAAATTIMALGVLMLA